MSASSREQVGTGAACAHSTVKCVYTQNLNGTTSCHWACPMCGMKFSPVVTFPFNPAPIAPEAGTVSREDLKDALNIGLAALGLLNTDQSDGHWNTQEACLRTIERRMRETTAKTSEVSIDHLMPCGHCASCGDPSPAGAAYCAWCWKASQEQGAANKQVLELRHCIEEILDSREEGSLRDIEEPIRAAKALRDRLGRLHT